MQARHTVVVPLKDSAYRFVGRLNANEIILAYGDPTSMRAWAPKLEVWRDVRKRCVATDVLRIRYGRRTFRFAGQLKHRVRGVK